MKYLNSFHGIYVIGKEEGLRYGLMKGSEASAMRSLLFSGARLGFYEPVKNEVTRNGGDKYPTVSKFVAAAIAGFLASGFSNPLELCKIRMQAQPSGEYRPLNWHIKDIYR